MTTKDKTEGLTCPNCNGIVPVPEGVRVVQCPYCQLTSLVRGDRGVRRWQVPRRVDREQALATVTAFFVGLNRARTLRREARIKETFLVYLPYWRVQALVTGFMLGRVKSGKDSTRPVEAKIQEEMFWNDAAVDVSEFGVHSAPCAIPSLSLTTPTRCTWKAWSLNRRNPPPTPWLKQSAISPTAPARNAA